LNAAKKFPRAAEMYIEASTCYGKADIWFLAGKNMEQAAQIHAKNLQSPGRAAELFKEAALSYKMNNSWDRAIDTLTKAGKLFEQANDFIKACEYYQSAVDCIDQEGGDRVKINGEIIQRYTILLLKANKMTDAIHAMRAFSASLAKVRSFSLWYLRNGVALITCLLHQGDEVAASKAFEQLSVESDGAWPRSDEAKLSSDILDAFQNHDQAKLVEIWSRQQVSFLDRDIVKVIKSLRVIGAELSGGSAVDASYIPQNSTSLVDDLPSQVPKPPEETSDLC
jgi:tetratricopeptide (TPR) repeat protein